VEVSFRSCLGLHSQLGIAMSVSAILVEPSDVSLRGLPRLLTSDKLLIGDASPVAVAARISVGFPGILLSVIDKKPYLPGSLHLAVL
jgi:hypothetical protein